MRTIAIDTEYDYCSPFLATTTDEELFTKVYRVKVLSQKRELKKICEDRNIQKVFHHATGDIFQLRNIGIKVADPVECTLIASNLVDENYKPRDLKGLVRTHLHIETHEANRLKSVIKKYKKLAEKGGYAFKWSQIPESVMIPYARRDPEYTLKLWHYWAKPIEESRELYEFEKSLIPLIVEMQVKGIRIDRYRCKRMSYEYGQKLENLHEEMVKHIVDNKIVLRKDFNPRSVQQMQDIILQMGLENKVEHKGIGKVPKTDKKALAILSMDSKFFSLVSKNRFFNKHKTTYYDPLHDYYTSEKNDIAHFLIYQTGAKTGRFSVELAQTFPKPEESKLAGELHEVRKCIIPRRGKAFLCMDYEQQEARLFCHYSNCQRMIDIINEKSGTKGFDIYIETAEVLFGELFQREKLRKALRFVSKTDFLGAIYGMGVGKLVSGTTALLYEKFDRSVVEEIGVNDRWAYEVLKKFKELYPVDEFNRSCMSELYKSKEMKLSFNSELMNFTRSYHIPQDFAYKAGNAKIQGCLYGGARIYTEEHGYIALKEIRDQIIMVWDGEKFVKAQCVYSGKKKKVIVQFYNGQQIICSPEHKFLCLNTRGISTGWYQAKVLKKNCRIVLGNAIPEIRYDIREGLQYDFNKYCKTGRTSWNRNEIDFTKIEDFDFGVVLGRLVSDGSITRNCEWLVAEHEYEIYEYLKTNLEKMGKVWQRTTLKESGSLIYNLTLGSVRLGRLFNHLKTEIPVWMFKNTEILRGYLRGMFDGDGSVSVNGKINLTQGGEISWTYMRKIQEALLLFGIRSRLHFYDYGYRCFHLNILMRDNQVFADRIGFINNKKQEKIKFDSKYYKKSLHMTESVESVNVTEEYIDMYDIVNSESGKYMANGLVTHNTAAYVIKSAMKRVDRRIETERWRGKVDVVLQVHDELIFELDNNLPFIKHVYETMRQEMDDNVTFKVPISTSGKWSNVSLGDVKEF